MTNPDQEIELTFTPIHEGQPPFVHRPSASLLKWLQKARPLTLDDLQRVMGTTSLPEDASTISICNDPPQDAEAPCGLSICHLSEETAILRIDLPP